MEYKNYDEKRFVKAIKSMKAHCGIETDEELSLICAGFLAQHAWNIAKEQGLVTYVSSAIPGIPEFAVWAAPKAFYKEVQETYNNRP